MKKRQAPRLRLTCHIIACGSAKDRATGWAFVTEPKNIEEHRLGSLFMIGEIDPEGRDEIPPILALVGSKLKQEYYAKPRRRALANFSESLRSGNTLFAQVPKKRNPMWLGKMHLAAGAFAEGVLYFTLIGKIRGYLFRGETTVDLSRRFLAEGRPHPTRLFRNIASGSLVPGDRLLFATPKIFTSLFLEDVRHITRESPFSDIPRQIELLYENQESRGALYMIAAEVGEDAVPPPREGKTSGSRWLRRTAPPPWYRRLNELLSPVKMAFTRLPDRFVLIFVLIKEFFRNIQLPVSWRIGALIIATILLLLLLVFRREIIL